MRHKSETQAPGRSRDTYASYNYERARISVESGFTNYALLRHRLRAPIGRASRNVVILLDATTGSRVKRFNDRVSTN